MLWIRSGARRRGVRCGTGRELAREHPERLLSSGATSDRRCVRHADTDGKEATELVEAKLTPDDVAWDTDHVTEHLSGAVLRSVEFPDGLSFGRRMAVGVEVSGGTLREADFRDTTRWYATFLDAEMSGADFRDADLLNGWYFSVITLSTVGDGDFYPISPVSRVLVGVESLTGALFIALFVFVVGQRVSR